MASKLLRRPGLNRVLVKVHEHLALTGLVAIARARHHAARRPWLKPGRRRRSRCRSRCPTARCSPGSASSPATWRRCSGFRSTRGAGSATRLWRKLHRATVAVYVLGVVHALGAGTDASTTWLRAFLLVTGAPILFLLLVRFLPRRQARSRACPARAAPPGAGPGVRDGRGPGLMATRPERRRDRRRWPCRPALCRDAAAHGLRRGDPDRRRRASCAVRPPAALEGVARGKRRAGIRRVPSRRAGTATSRWSCCWAAAPSGSTPARRRLHVDDGGELAYDDLLIATGSTRTPAAGRRRIRQRSSAARRRGRLPAAAGAATGRPPRRHRRRIHRPGGRGDRPVAGCRGHDRRGGGRAPGRGARRATWAAGSPTSTARRACGSCCSTTVSVFRGRDSVEEIELGGRPAAALRRGRGGHRRRAGDGVAAGLGAPAGRHPGRDRWPHGPAACLRRRGRSDAVRRACSAATCAASTGSGRPRGRRRGTGDARARACAPPAVQLLVGPVRAADPVRRPCARGRTRSRSTARPPSGTSQRSTGEPAPGGRAARRAARTRCPRCGG